MGATSALLAGVASTASNFSAQQTQANAVKAQGQFEGAMFDRNAAFTTLQAQDAIARGSLAAGQRATAGRVQNGQVVAGFSGQGVDVNVGTPQDVVSNNERLTALDVATIKNNAAREAWGYTTEATDLTLRGKFAREGANNAAAGIRANSYGTILSGAANALNFGRKAADEGAWSWLSGAGGGSTPNLRVPAPPELSPGEQEIAKLPVYRGPVGYR